MTKEKKTILVAWDFSENAKHALSHALFYSEQTGFNVYLLQIVRKKAMVNSTQVALENASNEIFEQENQKVKTIVKVGNMAEGLQLAATELNAAMIVGCFPGYNGIKKFISRYTMNAILGSLIPLIVVQESKKKSDIVKIICPIDYKKQSKAILSSAQFFSKFCKTEIYLVYPVCLTPFRRLVKEANLNFAKNYLKNIGLDFKEQEVPCKNYNQEIINFAKSENADLILNISQKESKLKNLFFNSNNYKFVANDKKVPVMFSRAFNGLKLTGFR